MEEQLLLIDCDIILNIKSFENSFLNKIINITHLNNLEKEEFIKEQKKDNKVYLLKEI